MKTAEQLTNEITLMLSKFGQPLTLPNIRSLQSIVNEAFKQIQLDACHSALSEAAELCAMVKYGSEYRPTENPSRIWKYTDEMEKAILALRDKKES